MVVSNYVIIRILPCAGIGPYVSLSLGLPGKIRSRHRRYIGIVGSYSRAQIKMVTLTGRTESSLAIAQVRWKVLYLKAKFISPASDIGLLEDVTALSPFLDPS